MYIAGPFFTLVAGNSVGYLQCCIVVVCSGIAAEKASTTLSDTLTLHLFSVTLYGSISTYRCRGIKGSTYEQIVICYLYFLHLEVKYTSENASEINQKNSHQLLSDRFTIKKMKYESL